MTPVDGNLSPKPHKSPLPQQTTFGAGFTIYKDWELSVELNLQANELENGHRNILQLMIPGNEDPQLGGRLPAVYQSPKSSGNKLLIFAHVNGPNTLVQTADLTPGWHWLKIANRVNECGTFMYSISIDGDQVHLVENNTPQVFKNVNAYLSNSYKTNGALGSFRNFRFES